MDFLSNITLLEKGALSPNSFAKIVRLNQSISFLAPTGALEEGILSVRPCVCYFPQKNMEKEL